MAQKFWYFLWTIIVWIRDVITVILRNLDFQKNENLIRRCSSLAQCAHMGGREHR